MITIQGVVNNEQERRQIEQQLRQLSGVKAVISKLRVAGQGGSTSGSRQNSSSGTSGSSGGTSDQP